MLPINLAPPPPFPLIAAQAQAREPLATGVSLVTYYLATSRGPLVVRAIALDPKVPTLRVGAVLAHDSLISPGETVSSMAQRTGAIAGINADYFDIGQTNQPLNIVVRDGTLLRTPSGRATVSFLRDRTLRFGTYSFSSGATLEERSWQIGGIDEWPPQGAGATLMLPAFGVPPPTPGVTFAQIEPLGPHSATSSGSYRVLSVERDSSRCEACTTLAFGVNAASVGVLPAAGDTIQVSGATEPALDGVVTALGGGPLLVKDAAAFEDPDPPSPSEALQSDPQAGVLRGRDGTVDFVCVDGRSRSVSVGLTRPEFAALLIGLGATDAMAFDSGGSATLVARSPGDRLASVQNVPSDGVERRVADGIFIYSDAPPGPPARLSVRPASLRLLVDARAAIAAVPTDASGRPAARPAARLSLTATPASLVRIDAGSEVVGARAGSGTLHVRLGTLEEDEPLTIVASLAHLRIEPSDPNPAPRSHLTFRAVGTGSAGEPILVDGAQRWMATAGQITADGEYTVSGKDAVVSVSAAGLRADSNVLVGESELSLAAFGARARWQFATVPPGGAGSVAQSNSDDQPVLELSYDFSRGGRAAYANQNAALPGRPLAMSVDVFGDGEGAGLRASFENADGDRIGVTLARHIDWHGWRRCTATLPANAAAPLRLRSLYVIAALSGAPVRASGTVSFRDLRLRLAGSAPLRQ